MAAAMTALSASRTFHKFLLRPSFPFRRHVICHVSTAPEAAATATTTNVISILRERGLLDSLTSDSLQTPGTNLKAYCGFDPTAESLHLGNLLALVVLSWFRRCGHDAVALIGGATGRVGDPSGKSLDRPLLETQTLESNSAQIKALISQIVARENPKNPILVLDNYQWWKDITLLDFLGSVGRFARVGTMIAKESVKRRISSEEGISFTEFTYQLLQGYDFVYLFKNFGVNVQIGGSDQWGNITAGTDLIRKILNADGAYGLTFPLLVKSDGTKFGKSESGAIWLNAKMLSPYKFYQYFFSVPDDDVVRFLKILTFLSMEEIEKIEEEMKNAGYVQNSAQRKLAEEVTRFVHGEEGLAEALKATEALRPGAETKLDWKTIEAIAEDVPSCSLSYDRVLGSGLVELAVEIGLFASKSAGRRLVKQGGFYLNNGRVDSDDKVVEEDDIVDGKVMLLSAGKKNKMVVRIS